MADEYAYDLPTECPCCGASKDRLEKMNELVDSEGVVATWTCHDCYRDWENHFAYTHTLILPPDPQDEQPLPEDSSTEPS